MRLKNKYRGIKLNPTFIEFVRPINILIKKGPIIEQLFPKTE